MPRWLGVLSRRLPVLLPTLLPRLCPSAFCTMADTVDIVAMDGPAGTGKSTTAKLLAERISYTYFDTGAMYRALTYGALKGSVSPDDTDGVERLLETFKFEICSSPSGEKQYKLNGQDVTTEIRTREVTANVSKVAAIPLVRQRLVDIQRQFGASGRAVFEGRDIGTVVFPHARHKFFLTASAEVRAQRRFDQLVAKDESMREKTSVEEIRREIEERDHIDSTREVSPLKQADDAFVLDTSHLTLEEVVLCMEREITDRNAAAAAGE